MKEHFCPVEKSMITYQGKCNWCGESEGSMNEIIEMARQVGIEAESDTLCRFGGWVEPFVAFAKLVAAKEREACAKVCETLWNTSTNGMATEEEAYGDECAAAIRVRGQT